MAVAVVGDVDPHKTEKIIKKRFAKLHLTLKETTPVYGIPDYDSVEIRRVSHESLDKVRLDILQLINPQPGVQTEQEYSLYLRQKILNKLISERFSNLSFNDPPYNNGNYACNDFLNVKGLLMGSVELIPGEIKKGIKQYALDVEQMFRYGFVSLEIEKIKSKYLNKLKDKAISNSPTPSSSFMDEIYSDYYTGNKFVTIKHEYELAKKYIGKIDSTMLVEQLHKIRNNEKTHYLISFFDKVKDEIPSPETFKQIFDSVRNAKIKTYILNYQVPDKLLEKEPVKGKISGEKIMPEIEAREITLQNGTTVLYKYSNRDKNHISISGFRAGGQYALDSADYVNGLVASQLVSLSGAGKFSRKALSHFLADKTTILHFVIDKTRSGLTGTSNHKDLETLFQLLYLRWTEPRADSTVFDQIKEKAIKKYLTSNKTATDTFYRDLAILMKGESYTMRVLSDSLLNSDLKLDRILPVYKESFGSAEGYSFIIIGDLPFEEVKPLIEKYIGGLPAGRVDNDYVYKGATTPDSSLTFEKNVGDNPRTSVSLIFQGKDIEQDITLYNIKAEILASVLRTRFLQTLREEMGKIYSVSVNARETQHPAALRRIALRFACDPDDADTLINRAYMEMQQLIDYPDLLSPILYNVKLNMIKKRKAQMQKNVFWSMYIRNCMFNNTSNWNSITKYDETVNSVTTREIADMIQKDIIGTPVIKALLNPKPPNISPEL
jgi:zinc protease